MKKATTRDDHKSKIGSDRLKIITAREDRHLIRAAIKSRSKDRRQPLRKLQVNMMLDVSRIIVKECTRKKSITRLIILDACKEHLSIMLDDDSGIVFMQDKAKTHQIRETMD